MIQAVTVSRYRWVIMGVLWVTYIVVFLNRLGIGPLGPFLKEELSLTSTQIGLIMSASMAGYTVTQIPAGWLVDRIGPKWPIAAGDFIAGAAIMGIFLAPSYYWLLILMFLAGMGSGFLMPATTKSVLVWFPANERATMMGLKQTAMNLGGMISAAVLPGIALAFGWRFGFFLLALTALVIGAASLVLYRDPPQVLSVASSRSNHRPGDFFKILKDRDIWLIAVAGFFLAWVEFSVSTQVVLYLKEDLLVDVIIAGQLLALLQFSGAVSRPTSGLISDRIFRGARKPPFIIMAAMSVVICLIIALWGRQLGWWIYPMIVLLGIGATGWGGLYLTILAELAGSRSAGTAIGFAVTVSNLGGVFGPPAFGFLVDATHSYIPAWLSLVAFSVACLVSLVFLKERRTD